MIDTWGYPSLHFAAASGDLAAVTSRIAEGADVNGKALGGLTPLMAASAFGTVDVVAALLGAGADLEAGCDEGYTALFHAAAYDNREVALALVASGADVSKQDPGVGYGNAIGFAAAMGCVSTMEGLWNSMPPEGYPLWRGLFALFNKYGMRTKSIDDDEKGQRMVIDKPFDLIPAAEAWIVGQVTTHDADEHTGWAGRAELEATNGLRIRHDPSSFTDEDLLCANDHPSATRLLGVALGQVDRNGIEKDKAPLHLAVELDQIDYLRSLIATGVDLEMWPRAGSSAPVLHQAALEGRRPLMELLLGAGAKVDGPNKWGATPLMVVAGAGLAGMCEALLAAGADPDRKDDNGADAHAWAAGKPEIQALLRARPAVEPEASADDSGVESTRSHPGTSAGISRFESPRSQDRIDAIADVLVHPQTASVVAFCRRWLHAHQDCVDSHVPIGASDEQRSRAQGEYYRLQDEFAAGMKRLRAIPDGLYACAAGLGMADPGQAEQGLRVCLARAAPDALVSAFTRLRADDAAAAGRALDRLLPHLEDDEERLRAFSTLAPGKVEKTKKEKEEKSRPPSVAGRLEKALAGHGSSDVAELSALAAESGVKGLNRARVFDRLAQATADPAERLTYLDQAWDALPSKKSKDPGWRILSTGVRLAVALGNEEGVLRWFLRHKLAQTASQFRSFTKSGMLAPWILRPGFREHVLPKYRKAMQSVKSQLDDSLLATCALRDTSTSGPHLSRIGGPPFLLAGLTWPCDRKGVPMHFLLQLNFDDCPSPDGFPARGMLLLFVPNDHTLGLGFGGARSEYAAVWVDEVDPGQPVVDAAPFEQRCLAEGARQKPLVAKPAQIAFDLEIQPAIPMDARFARLVPGAASLKPKALQAFEKRWCNPRGYGGYHRLGGYASFVQGEPRRGETADYVQLVQLDSYAPWDLMFGDGGLAHFFIHPDDLAARRFDNMLYYWDCA